MRQRDRETHIKHLSLVQGRDLKKKCNFTGNSSLSPFLGLGNCVALRANFFVERNDHVRLQHGEELLLGRRHLRVLLDLEDGADEDPRVLPLQVFVVSANHVQEGGDQARVRVELDVRGEDEVGVGGLAGNVAAHVHWVVKRAATNK